ncbi:MAG: UDP-N-acetylmuramoyl-L-alanyl-D-glutamate--2,6-diaminopimelate ligase [Mariprofundaceae bacterium]|nr:UDP-N-acetylmuramoyl-L-alanyl-D-glutamate--2,6-diaminopimelate ligase [Mariprofundaceae bacterium]
MSSAQSILTKLSRRAPRSLGDIWSHTPAKLRDIQITGVQQDSRLLRQGEAWLCLPSTAEKQTRYMQMAADAGASVCIYVGAVANNNMPSLPILHISDMVAAGNWLRHWFNTQNTTTRIIGITGTDGKTSVTWMLRDVLEQKLGACWSAGTLGWIDQRGKHSTLGNTTASLLNNHQLLAAATDAEIPYVVMEVSSHGIDQQRIAGMPFAAAIWTTMGRDHLDYHLNMQTYQNCKAGFIDGVAKAGGTIIANGDQTDIVKLQEGRVTWWYARGSQPKKDDLLWHIPSEGKLELQVENHIATASPVLGGSIHGQNLAAVATFLYRHNGDSLNAIAGYLSKIDAPPGRMQPIADTCGRRVFVDYAHTPNALIACLTAAREISLKRLLLVFGCGGERDQGKRPLMGQAARAYADLVWVTNDNPRDEEPHAIISDIMGHPPAEKRPNIEGEATVCIMQNRSEAIASAVATLAAGDVLLIAGKGHEDYMEFARGKRQPWSDIAVASEALKNTAVC